MLLDQFQVPQIARVETVLFMTALISEQQLLLLSVQTLCYQS